MNKKSLVLVVGAGASCEVNLPVGTALKSQIADILQLEFDDFGRLSGDSLIRGAVDLIVAEEKEEPNVKNKLVGAAKKIRDSMPLAISIDNFIDSHRGNREVAQCGKLAIARCILEAERNSKLYVDPSNTNNRLDFASLSNTWYNGFFQILTENCQQSELEERLKKVGIITFNYDRCIEQYLRLALQVYYDLSKSEAMEILKGLDIYHPYGMVGNLPGIGRSDEIEFGGHPDNLQLFNLSKKIRTFTESTAIDFIDIAAIRETIDSAERLVFLGFAFHQLNLELLFAKGIDNRYDESCFVYGTAFGISQQDLDVIEKRLRVMNSHRNITMQLDNGVSCSKLFERYSRSISLV